MSAGAGADAPANSICGRVGAFGSGAADAFKEDQRLGIEMFLQCGKIIGLADVRDARQLNCRSFPARRHKFSHGDLEFHEVGLGSRDANVRLGRQLIQRARSTMSREGTGGQQDGWNREQKTKAHFF